MRQFVDKTNAPILSLLRWLTQNVVTLVLSG